MIDPTAIERHLKVCHSHFGEKNIFDSDGVRIEGYFVQMLEEGEVDHTPENVRYFHSPTLLSKNATLTDRLKSITWRIKGRAGEEQAYVYTLERTT